MVTITSNGQRTHVFYDEDSREVYDRTQWDDGIQDGDILVIQSEQIVGFLAGAWPIAVTAEHGELHGMKDGVAWGNVGTDRGLEYGHYLASAIEAETIARDNRWPLRVGR